MVSLIQTLTEWFNAHNRRVFFLMTEISYGNRAEEVLFASLKVRREGKKLYLIRVYRWLYSRKANEALLRLESDLVWKPNLILDQFLIFFFSFSVLARKVMALPIHKILWILSGGPNRVTRKVATWCKYPSIGWRQLWEAPADIAKRGFSRNFLDASFWKEQLEDVPKWSIPNVPPDQERAVLENDLGIPRNSWFVCVHVRDNGFHRESQPTRRDATIANYLPTFDLITSYGGIVVRLGDPAMPALPQKDSWIDYAHHPKWSETLDLILIKNCRFYIGSPSGPADVAALFGKKMLMCNTAYRSHPIWYRKGSLCLPKTILRKGENRPLTFWEWVQEDDLEGMHGTGANPDLVYIENTPEEIVEATTLFLEDRSHILDDLQREASAFWIENTLQQFESLTYYPDPEQDALEKMRWGIRLVCNQGAFCSHYLRKKGE